jgi:rod shape determining protein RodA
MLRPYQKDRILTFLNPESDPLGAGWNIIQSKIAIGAGGMTGKGRGQGSQSHLDYLPEHTTDFIFAVLSEEFGWIGVATVLALYLFVIGRCLWIAAEARDGYARLLAGCAGPGVLRLRDRQRRHDLRHVAGGGRADAAAQLRRHVGGVACSRDWAW